MNTTSNQFGLLVAYLLPGFIGLAGIAPFAPAVAAWLRPGTYAEASLGAPVYAILAAATIGMIVSSIRWLIVDHIHHWTGITPPHWDDSRLEQRLSAFNYLVESHYRYYQFLANSLIAIICAYAINRAIGTSPFLGIGTDLGVLILCATLFAGSRDALSKYYTRTGRLIGHVAEKVSTGDIMTNGNHPDLKESSPTTAHSEARPAKKPEPTSKPVKDKTSVKQATK